MKCYIHPEMEAVATCTNCGRPICSNCAVDFNGRIVCRSCAGQASSPYPGMISVRPRKEPILSLILSFLIPGLGQLYNGQASKAAVLFLAYLAFWVLAIVLVIILIGLCLTPIPFAIWIYSMYDAYVTANKINMGELV